MIEFLMEDNKNQKREVEETRMLLDAAKKAAEELKLKLEETFPPANTGGGLSLEDELKALSGGGPMLTTPTPRSTTTTPKVPKHSAEGASTALLERSPGIKPKKALRMSFILQNPMAPESQELLHSIARGRSTSFSLGNPREMEDEDEDLTDEAMEPQVSSSSPHGEMEAIRLRIQRWRKRAKSFSHKRESRRLDFDKHLKRFQLLGLLQDQIDSAETQLNNQKERLEEDQRKKERLEDIVNKLRLMEEKLRGKDDTISKLKQEIDQQKPLVKDGWVYKRGDFMKIWNKRWLLLSSNGKEKKKTTTH
jgi:hypothetical protein